MRPTTYGATALVTLSVLVLAGGSGASAAEPGEWSSFDGGPDAVCADGSAVDFLERRASPAKVVLYYEGGGACFSTETCAFEGEGSTYISDSSQALAGASSHGGIFDADNPENPVADYSFVYVPYCTGDGHLGTATHRYSDELTVEHKGFVNAMAALDHVVETYPEVTDLLVTGMSAGSIPTPLMAGLAADRRPGARIVTLGDGSGAYPDEPVLNAYIGSLWGTDGAIPEWAETAALTLDDWSVPGLYVYAGRHAPAVTFAKVDYAYDAAQEFYAQLVGLTPDDLVAAIDDIEAGIESSGVNVASFVAPGDDHTVIATDELYELQVEGVRLIDWVTRLIDGETPDDVHCVGCR